MAVVLRQAQVWGTTEVRDVVLPSKGGHRPFSGSGAGHRPFSGSGAEPVTLDLEGRLLLPGLVNAHDHLDFSTFPPLGHPPYPSAYAWAREVDAGRGAPAARAALEVPLADRLWLGGLRNLLAGVTAVAHHNPYHRSLARPDFPVQVLAKYNFAHSPGITPRLKGTYRTTDRRIPWMVHAGEGVDEEARSDLSRIQAANCLRQNTVLVHGLAFDEADARAIAAARASVVWCPESNRRLYGSTADVVRLRAAGVRIGLGSDSPVSGVRDALSNLAAARSEGVFSDAELLELATHGSAVAARLPCGGLEDGQPRDLLVVNSPEGLLGGDRGAVVLVLVGGRPRYGRDAWMATLVPASVPCEVDGHPRRLEPGLAQRLRAILRDHPRLKELAWLAGVRLAA